MRIPYNEMELEDNTGRTSRLQVRLSQEELRQVREAAYAVSDKKPKAWSLQKFALKAILDACNRGENQQK